jgi:hypothetical protein
MTILRSGLCPLAPTSSYNIAFISRECWLSARWHTKSTCPARLSGKIWGPRVEGTCAACYTGDLEAIALPKSAVLVSVGSSGGLMVSACRNTAADTQCE